MKALVVLLSIASVIGCADPERFPDADELDADQEQLDADQEQLDLPEDQWVWIDPGRFLMGSPDDEAGRGDNEQLHQVELTRGYFMQATEVTQQQFEELMGHNPSRLGCPRCPVDHVSWHDAAAYCNELSDQLELDRCYDCQEGACELAERFETPYECSGARLPTEAEWEHAARAGLEGETYGDHDDLAWWEGNAEGNTHPVAELGPNLWGLYDMLGNILEATGGLYEYPISEVIDPWGDGELRVYRGGSYSHGPQHVRFASRVRFEADSSLVLGFRPVRAE